MDKKWKKRRTRIIAALLIYIVLFVLHHLPGHAGIPDNKWLWLCLFLVPYIIAGYDVVRKAVLGIVHGQMFDESFLMVLATVGAFATGEFSEACAVILFYQVGELFQDYAVGRSRGSIRQLMEIAPEYANVVREDGSVEKIDPDDVQVGDTILVRPGEKIPVDGTVLEGRGLVNTAALTGESVPRTVCEGGQVISGCVNGETLLKIRADKAYEDSTVVRILELVENAASRKSRTENFITRFARWYTPLVVFAALALAIIPSIITRQPDVWIYRACTFLVISCPCALVISTPLAFFGGIGAASDCGVLVKGSNYLEALSRLETVVSDKTGTMTKGEFRVWKVIPAGTESNAAAKEEVLEAAALAESASTHPIAVSIREALGHPLDMSRVGRSENKTGRGLTAEIDGEEVLVGNGRMMEEAGIVYEEVDDAASTIVYVARGGRFLGTILIADTIKEGAAKAITDMKREGVRQVIMLTGDRKEAADAVGEKLGVDRTYSELLPDGKVAKVEDLLRDLGAPEGGEPEENAKRGTLAFIGDGINDAPVLSRADIGIAMGSMGSDAAIEAADVVIMDDDLERIPMAIRISHRTVRIARENIVFALAVKFLILILGALGIAGMWAAVFADVGVACICILNSMRLLHRTERGLQKVPVEQETPVE